MPMMSNPGVSLSKPNRKPEQNKTLRCHLNWLAFGCDALENHVYTEKMKAIARWLPPLFLPCYFTSLRPYCLWFFFYCILKFSCPPNNLAFCFGRRHLSIFQGLSLDKNPSKQPREKAVSTRHEEMEQTYEEVAPRYWQTLYVFFKV